MLENIRAAMAQDKYITKGGKETIAPRFTYHGYRYVEITGIDKALPLESVKGTVLSSIDGLASQYETSNEKVNQLWHNIVWSTYANFFSIPTDCPQRNECLGGREISRSSPGRRLIWPMCRNSFAVICRPCVMCSGKTDVSLTWLRWA